jgi:ABC-type nitrate/sulfonate/bicarbonate transport system substrate-binding protein
MKSVLVLLLALAFISQASEPTPVRIAYPSGMNGMIVKVLEKSGIAEKHGLKPTFTFFQYGPPMMEAVAAGNIDVVATSLNPVASYLSKSPGALEIVAQLNESSHGLIAQNEISGDSITALKGKTIAVSFNSDSHVDLLLALQTAGLDPAKDVKLLNTPPNELAGLLVQKQADAVLIRQPQLARLEQDKAGRVLQRWPHKFLAVATRDLLAKNAGVEERLRAAFKEAIFFIIKNPDQSAEWFGEHLRVKPELVKTALAEDATFKAESLEKIDVSVSAEFQTRTQARLQSIEKVGILKTRPQLTFK